MKVRLIAGVAAAVLGGTAASAAVVTLENRVDAPGGTEFQYEITLGPDEGLRPGDQIIIFDFLGYVDGSIFAPAGLWSTSTQLVSEPEITPGEDDDPGIVNLLFTYTGEPFRVEDGPFDAFSFTGFGAVSTFSMTALDAFTSTTTKNNPEASEGTVLIQGGTTEVPSGVIPEPATWAMMMAGFGLVGASLRRRSVPRTMA
jgi:hypothetical protein